MTGSLVSEDDQIMSESRDEESIGQPKFVENPIQCIKKLKARLKNRLPFAISADRTVSFIVTGSSEFLYNYFIRSKRSKKNQMKFILPTRKSLKLAIQNYPSPKLARSFCHIMY